jgi:MATE family multidrug resistance protein
MGKTAASDTGNAPLPAAPAAIGPWRREAWATLRLATPLILSQLAAVAIGTTDIVMMGWLGPEKLAAGALGVNFYFPIYLFGVGLVNAVTPMTAQALGARRFRAVRRTLRQGLWVVLAYTVPVSLLIWEGRAVLIGFGQTETNAVLAQGYLRAAVWGLGPSLGVVTLRCFLSAHSRPRSVLVVTLLGVGVNALGNYALMFGHFGFPALGLVGAGISSALVHAFMFLALIGFVVRDRRLRRYAPLYRFWRADWPRFREIVKIGAPIGLTIMAESGMFSAAAFLMGILGTTQLAAHAIALQCAAVAFMVPLGVSQAATVRVGLAVGAGDRAGVGRAGWAALALGAGFAVFGALLFWLLPRPLVDLFLDLGAPEQWPVVELAVSLLGIVALFQVFDGAQIIAAGALRGLKDTRVPMIMATFGYWPVGFGTSALLGFALGLGGLGIWAGLALGLMVVAVLVIWRFHRRDRWSPAFHGPVPAGP